MKRSSIKMGNWYSNNLDTTLIGKYTETSILESRSQAQESERARGQKNNVCCIKMLQNSDII